MPTFKNLHQMQEYINQKIKNATINDLFSLDFMHRYTSFVSLQDFLANGNFSVHSMSDLKNINISNLDTYIASKTQFSSWAEFLKEAEFIYLKSLGIPINHRN